MGVVVLLSLAEVGLAFIQLFTTLLSVDDVVSILCEMNRTEIRDLSGWLMVLELRKRLRF